MSLIESTGLAVDPFYIPPFTLNEGEIAIIQLPSGPPFTPLLFELANLLCGKQPDPNIIFSTRFNYAGPIQENFWQRTFFPLTVGAFIKKNANPQNSLPQKIYEEGRIQPHTKIRALPGHSRKLLTLLTSLSHHNKLIFDLATADPEGGKKLYHFVKEQVGKTGAAILIDRSDEFKNECSVYVKYEIISVYDMV